MAVIENLEKNILPQDEEPRDIRLYLLKTNDSANNPILELDWNKPSAELNLIKSEIERIQGIVDNLSSLPIPKTNKYGRKRNHREQTDIFETRKKDVEKFEYMINVLNGKIMTPITLIRENNELKAIKID